MLIAASTATDTTILVIAILGAVLLFLLIFFVLYLIIASRRASIVLKKIDYLVEDLTYKSEMMNSSVELISKASNYLNASDALLKGNMKSLLKFLFGNKNYFYFFYNKLKDLFTSEETENDEPKEESGKKSKSSNKNKKVVESETSNIRKGKK